MALYGTNFFGFEIMLKCMLGSTTENGKFIVPLAEKMTYENSENRCTGQG